MFKRHKKDLAIIKILISTLTLISVKLIEFNSVDYVHQLLIIFIKKVIKYRMI